MGNGSACQDTRSRDTFLPASSLELMTGSWNLSSSADAGIAAAPARLAAPTRKERREKGEVRIVSTYESAYIYSPHRIHYPSYSSSLSSWGRAAFHLPLCAPL